MDVKEKIKELSKKFSGEITGLRRKIHQNPELSFKEFETSKLIQDKLTRLKIDKVQRISDTGVVGLIKNKNGKCVALRADIDALPIQEKTGLSFSSKNPGVMHPSGPDAHTSMFYGVSLILK